MGPRTEIGTGRTRTRSAGGALRLAVVLALLAVPAIAQAYDYQVNKTVVNEYRNRLASRVVRELENRWTSSIRYRYELDKEECFSWSVTVTVLRRYSLGNSRTGCNSTGTYTAAGTLPGGYTLRIWGQEVQHYRTYYAERQRVYDDGSYDVLGSTYATKKTTYDVYWSNRSL